jgi:hypothetical protein
MTKVFLLNVQHDSKEAAKQYVKEKVIDLLVPGFEYRKGTPEFWALRELIDGHQRAADKLQNGVRGFRRMLNERGNGYEIQLIDDNGNAVGFSWQKCIFAGSTEFGRLTRAMRFAIEDQVRTFRSSVPVGTKCMACGKVPGSEVDHYDPTFSELRNNFLAGREDYPSVYEDSDSEWKIGPSWAKWERDWQAHHKSLARLRWVCRQCNAERKTKEAADEERGEG